MPVAGRLKTPQERLLRPDTCWGDYEGGGRAGGQGRRFRGNCLPRGCRWARAAYAGAPALTLKKQADQTEVELASGAARAKGSRGRHRQEGDGRPGPLLPTRCPPRPPPPQGGGRRRAGRRMRALLLAQVEVQLPAVQLGRKVERARSKGGRGEDLIIRMIAAGGGGGGGCSRAPCSPRERPRPRRPAPGPLRLGTR